MIENKELGLKIAESPEEALWIRARDACKARIIDYSKKEIKIN